MGFSQPCLKIYLYLFLEKMRLLSVNILLGCMVFTLGKFLKKTKLNNKFILLATNYYSQFFLARCSKFQCTASVALNCYSKTKKKTK